MKFTISDDAVLKVVGIGTAVHAVHWACDPKGAHEWHFNATTVPYEEATARSYAFALGGMAAQTLAVGLSTESKNAQKNALLASGATWLVGAAILAHNACNSKSGQDKDFVYGAAAGHAALGALCLWRGCTKEGKWEKELW